MEHISVTIPIPDWQVDELMRVVREAKELLDARQQDEREEGKRG